MRMGMIYNISVKVCGVPQEVWIMSKTKNNFIAPIAVLVVICFVASAILAGIFQITDPTIQRRAAEAASEARTKVLPLGRDFELFDGELTEGITDAYVAGNGAGVVSSTSFNGFGGAVKLMVGMDQDGKITGIQVMEQSETPGVGSNALTDSYLAGYTGLENSDGVDAWSGATWTSKAVKRGVDAAAAQFGIIKNAQGGQGDAPSEAQLIKEAVAAFVPSAGSSPLSGEKAEGVISTYSNSDKSAFAVLVEDKGYNDQPMRLVVGLDAQGKITGIKAVYHNEVKGIGAEVFDNETFLAQFTGADAIAVGESQGRRIDAVSGATDTSNGIIRAAAAALAQYALIKSGK